MPNIFDYYFLGLPIPILLTIVLATISYFYIFTRFFKRYRLIPVAEYRKKISLSLLSGLKSGVIKELEDVFTIYTGLSGNSPDYPNFRYKINNILRTLFVMLVNKEIDKELPDSELKDYTAIISKFIKENNDISPFDELPIAEGNVIADLAAIKVDDNDYLKRKLLELSGMIKARCDDFKKISAINKWTIPLSIIGIILTIGFGIIALIFSAK